MPPSEPRTSPGLPYREPAEIAADIPEKPAEWPWWTSYAIRAVIAVACVFAVGEVVDVWPAMPAHHGVLGAAGFVCSLLGCLSAGSMCV